MSPLLRNWVSIYPWNIAVAIIYAIYPQPETTGGIAVEDTSPRVTSIPIVTSLSLFRDIGSRGLGSPESVEGPRPTSFHSDDGLHNDDSWQGQV